ncbi:MAG TPA: xanthan lyase, partial [Planctomycetaceae bacterium]|nr:xanthan lyase [Planctomycetaceae bacterium]
MTQSLRLIFGFILGSQLLSSSLLQAEQSEVEFFEKKIRPVLVKHCYECHSVEASAVKGGLLLDSREGLLAGGDSGPSLVPGKSAESTLIESLKYESYEMPPSGKLPEHVIRDFEQWIDTGAIDPRAPTQKQTQAGIDWEAARQFWAYQPLPESTPAGLSTTKLIDHSLQQELDKVGATSNPIASPEQRIRRLYYDLTGLPPSPRQIMDFVNDPSAVRWENTVEELLASKQFGEHWGRHWLDVVRYADSNGNDFNATYHNAWRYRNYVIEAFNNDKPFDQFLREQIAGDL